ncbi:MAG: glycosyl hydrolase [Streptosporangiaceae bacterium]|jgi:glycosyl hydrolase family 26
MSPSKLIASLIALACAAAVCVHYGLRYERAGDAASRNALSGLAPVRSTLNSGPEPLLGAYIPGMPDSTASLTRFEKSTGTKEHIAVYYSSWGEPFKSGFARTVRAMGAVPLVQIDPGKLAVSDIADGGQDDYLISYAQAVRAYSQPVILSFGREFNGDWYRWGYEHTSPATFVAAWRHIVTVFRRQGAYNVVWLWTADVLIGSRTADPKAWWPGSSYVTWVGVDGYYRNAGDTFAHLFNATLSDIRAITDDPVLVAETAIAADADRIAQIPNLFQTVKADKLVGFVWFDTNGTDDWVIDNDPSALAAFGAAARRYDYQGG